MAPDGKFESYTVERGVSIHPTTYWSPVNDETPIEAHLPFIAAQFCKDDAEYEYLRQGDLKNDQGYFNNLKLAKIRGVEKLLAAKHVGNGSYDPPKVTIESVPDEGAYLVVTGEFGPSLRYPIGVRAKKINDDINIPEDIKAHVKSLVEMEGPKEEYKTGIKNVFKKTDLVVNKEAIQLVLDAYLDIKEPSDELTQFTFDLIRKLKCAMDTPSEQPIKMGEDEARVLLTSFYPE